MTPVGQILHRNLHRLEPGGSLNWFNPETDDTWRSLSEKTDRLSLWCQDFSAYERLKAAGAPVEFGAFPGTNGKQTDHHVLSLPRSKQRLAMLLDFISFNMTNGSRLWLVGENRVGIKSSSRLLEQRFSVAGKLDSARHCGLFEAMQPKGVPDFSLRDYCQEWTAETLPGKPCICSYPGVFAHGKPDPGTSLLIEQLPAIKPGTRVLDFGCGCGLISACIGKLAPEADLTLVDSDALALSAAEKTIQANLLEAKTVPCDGLAGLDRRFDLIVSNPPFHHGTQTDMRLGMKLLAPVRNFLNPGGQLLMVGNRHLPYRKWLDGIFGSHQVLASNNHFQVLIAVQST